MFNGRANETTDSVIDNQGFWTNINIGEFIENRSIPLQIPLSLVKSALVYAMGSLDLDLKEVEENYRSQGYNHINEVPAPQFEGNSFFEQLYKKAVFARAKNELLPEFATLSARELHEKRDLVGEQKQLQAEAVHAIRTLKGKTRGGVYFV